MRYLIAPFSERLMSVFADMHPWPLQMLDILADSLNTMLTLILPNVLLTQLSGWKCSLQVDIFPVRAFPSSLAAGIFAFHPYFRTFVFFLPLELYSKSNNMSAKKQRWKLRYKPAHGWVPSGR